MSVTTEHLPILSGRDWTKISNTTFSFSIQNTLDVRLEWSFVNDPSIARGLFLDVSSFLENVKQDLYVRIYDSEQNGTVAIVRYTEPQGFDSGNIPMVNANINKNRMGYDAWGKNKVVIDKSTLHAMATFEISPKIWFVDENGVELANASTSTKVTSKYGAYHLRSGITLGDVATLRAKRHPRYQPDRGWRFATAGTLPNKNASAIRIFGGVTEESGLFFELNNGILYAVVRRAAWEYYTATTGQTIFTLTEDDISPTSNIIVRTRLSTEVVWSLTTDYTVDDTTNTITFNTGRTLDEEVFILVVNDVKADLTAQLLEYNIDIEKETLYDIQAQWRGAGDAFFMVNFIEMYVYRNLQIGVTPIISNPALPIRYECVNKGDEVTMLMGCADISSEGGELDYIEYTPISNDPALPIIATDINNSPTVLLVAHSPLYYKGRHNTRDFLVLRVSASVEKNTFLTVYRSRNPVFDAGSLLLKGRDDGSAILYDNMLTADDTAKRAIPLTLDVSSAEQLPSKRISANTSGSIDNPNIYRINYSMSHGDYLILTASYEKVGTSEVVGSIELGEEI